MLSVWAQPSALSSIVDLVSIFDLCRRLDPIVKAHSGGRKTCFFSVFLHQMIFIHAVKFQAGQLDVIQEPYKAKFLLIVVTERV